MNGAYYVTRFLSGKDIRHYGSGNAGARNAGRLLGKKGFFFTLFIDISKTMVALITANYLANGNDAVLAASAIAVLLGHFFPVQLRFHGGKGVVVFLSATLYLVPVAILVTGVVMGTGYMLFRRFTIPGLAALSTIPITSFFFSTSWTYTVGLFAMLTAVILSHIINLHPSPKSST